MSEEQSKYEVGKKDDRIVIRIETEIKEIFNQLMSGKGTNASDFLRQYIIETINKMQSPHKETVKDLVMNITHPETDIYKRIAELESKVNILENILIKHTT